MNRGGTSATPPAPCAAVAVRSRGVRLITTAAAQPARGPFGNLVLATIKSSAREKETCSVTNTAPAIDRRCSTALTNVDSTPSTYLEAAIARLYEMALPQETEPVANRITVVLVHKECGFSPARPVEAPRMDCRPSNGRT